MREIKFRAWHKKYKRMYKVLHWHCPSMGESQWVTVEGFCIIEHKEIHIQIQPKDCVLMQYTGLKDSNGKEIYEGDIVKADDEEYPTVGDNAIGDVIMLSIYGVWYVNGTINDGLGDLLHGANTQIVGNIYENPNLLT